MQFRSLVFTALVAAAASAVHVVSAFVPPASSLNAIPSTAGTTALNVADVASASSQRAPVVRNWEVEKLDRDDAIMDVASYRNNRTGPKGVIAKQLAKREAQDNTGAAVRGGVTGLALGAAYGYLTYTGNGDVQEALVNTAALGGIMATLLAGNSLSGRNVYVSTLDDATNRLKVDFVEGLMARQDVGFAARIDDADTAYGGRFSETNGVVGAIDCQLRNCEASENVKIYGALPPHIHIKNLAVDQKCRRMGIARELVQAVEEYAKTTDAELITLVVDDSNTQAVNLYKSEGYDIESIGNPTTAMPKYGQWTSGRSIMSKKLEK
mmetsp:Transcript_24307/g.53704  ORF Transcript_24307/g.53704 Transcript_24307/m.53704 type:complete len:324 (-) Transcript_24307:38-1009(-)